MLKEYRRRYPRKQKHKKEDQEGSYQRRKRSIEPEDSPREESNKNHNPKIAQEKSCKNAKKLNKEARNNYSIRYQRGYGSVEPK